MKIEEAIEITRLDNGVRIVSEHIPHVASVTIGVWIAAGARHESAAENGLAHFLEHMAFKGTGRRSAEDIAKEIENGGGDTNAYTSRETTAYHGRVLAEEATTALDVIADILRDPKMAAEDVELERGVILQEIGMCRDTPDDIIFDWSQELSFPEQALGRPILGAPETIAAVDGDVLKSFMGKAYAPDRLVVAAAGAIEHDAFARQAESLFGDMASAPGGVSEAARYHGGERRVIKDLEQAHMIVGLPAPSYREDDFYESKVFATLLGGGMSSRLFQEAREKRGLCYAIGAHPSNYLDAGLMTVYAGAGGEDISELMEVIGRQLRDAALSPQQEEVDRAKAMLRAGLLMGLESSAARCERAARGVLLFDRVRPIDEIIARVDAVDADSLRAFGERRILNAEPTLTLYGPVEAAPSLDLLQAHLAA